MAKTLARALKASLGVEGEPREAEFWRQVEFLLRTELELEDALIRRKAWPPAALKQHELWFLVQDLLLHFEEVHLAPWNVYVDVSRRAGRRSRGRARDPVQEFRVRMAELRAAAGHPKMAGAWLSVWAALAEVLAECLRASGRAVSPGPAPVGRKRRGARLR